ncbi:MAG: hypothetical protein JXQ29_14040, partial [Planctomycetes bacterium]|nr:hypothetical protein [Planctomycetota bacterium]
MRTLSFLVLLSTALCLGPTEAQPFRPEEDIAFARGLMNRRMHDLAKEVLDRVLEDRGATLAERASAQLARAAVEKDEF